MKGRGKRGKGLNRADWRRNWGRPERQPRMWRFLRQRLEGIPCRISGAVAKSRLSGPYPQGEKGRMGRAKDAEMEFGTPDGLRSHDLHLERVAS